MPTPHISAEVSEIAPIVLMPGDPLRAKFIAENYLDDVKCYNKVRNMLGFTGKYKGTTISVQGSGMGVPSIGIYSHELFTHYNVESIIRIGTAGGINEKVKLRDIVIGMGACTNSNYGSQYGINGHIAPIASYELLSKAVSSAEKLGVDYHVGNLYTSDTFYDDNPNALSNWAKLGVLAVEMEAAALYLNAMRLNKKALAITTISDLPLQNQSTSSEEREKSFTKMMELALEM